MAGALPALPAPTFLTDADGLDPNKVIADIVAQYQALTGRALQPAQVERLLLNMLGDRESLLRTQVQYTGQQCLLYYAAFPALDYLGALMGVTRLAAQPALTSLQFTLGAPLAVPYTIPAGAQVGTLDGLAAFATSADLVIPAGQTTGSVGAAATVAGTAANGYLPGQVATLMTPNALISAVVNTSATAGGSAPETDDHLRIRIQAAPNSFSAAGPAAAYRFFALGVDPSIIDAQVVSPAPGQVNVYILIGPPAEPSAAPNGTGVPSPSLLAKVAAALSADDVRPLDDTVNVFAVTEVDYQIQASVELYSDAVASQVMAAVNQATQQWAVNQASRIQRDIVPENLLAALGSIAGVYRALVLFPTYTQLQPGQWANCTNIAIAQTTSAEHS